MKIPDILLHINLPDLVLLTSILIHLILCPYTKVEESFNMQAGYDLLHYNIWSDLNAFDHLEFSGVVPRTFVGSIVVTLVSLPLHVLNQVVMHVKGTLLSSPPVLLVLPAIVYRATLGMIVWLAFCSFRQAVQSSRKFSPRTSTFFSVLLALQFHIPYYASRSLPNTFALALVMVAYGFWFRNKPTTCLCVIGISTVLFRCDMLVLLAPMALQMLLCEQLPFQQTFVTGVVVCLVTLLVSIPMDSYLWTRLLWPEGEVLFFNTVENRSSEWGSFPWHWYFTAALPKALHTNIPLVMLGMLNPYSNSRQERGTLWYYLFPTLCFLCLYSFLPHKELRFVFPAIPLFTLAAARGLDSILPLSWLYGNTTAATTTATSNTKSSHSAGRLYRFVACVCSLGFIAVTLTMTSVFSLASQYNYPGGEALLVLNTHLLLTGPSASLAHDHLCGGNDMAGHVRMFDVNGEHIVHETCLDLDQRESESDIKLPTRIHIDAAAAMSGINR